MSLILLIEDELLDQKMYSKVLEDSGYKVEVASNGSDGLKMALAEHPDLILLDMLMPGMSGLETLTELRKNDWGRDARVIFLTNKDPNDEELKIILNNHPSFYLMKPTNDPKDVLLKVEEVLSNS